jgi:probable rRNA maturation factor
MSILFNYHNVKFDIKNKRILRKWINAAIKNENKECGSINYIFTNDSFLLELNIKYLSHNYFTDIITFNYSEDHFLSGDIYISLETVKSNSIKYGCSFEEELRRVIIHGVLHLIGYDDLSQNEKRIMREKENYYLFDLTKF